MSAHEAVSQIMHSVLHTTPGAHFNHPPASTLACVQEGVQRGLSFRIRSVLSKMLLDKNVLINSCVQFPSHTKYIHDSGHESILSFLNACQCAEAGKLPVCARCCCTPSSTINVCIIECHHCHRRRHRPDMGTRRHGNDHRQIS